MAEPEVSPIVSHLLRMIEGRQSSEAAKIALLADLNTKAAEMCSSLEAIHEQLAEILERAKAK